MTGRVEETTEVFATLAEMRDAGYAQHGPPVAFAALDPSGSGEDRTALVVVEREMWRRGELYDPVLSVIKRYVLRAAWLFDREATFPDILGAILALDRNLCAHESKNRLTDHFFSIEVNGVGWPFYSQLAAKIGSQRALAITTTAGTSANLREDRGWSMPRQAGVDNLRTCMEQHTFKVAPDAVNKDKVAHELNAFIWANNKPQATKGEHDDLVLALAIAMWTASQIVPIEVVPIPPRDHSIAHIHTGVGHG